jgi:selenocysteine lyase/cysteine desulfurase
MPVPVSEACKRIADEIEANPDRFIRLTYEPRHIRSRERIAEVIGAEVDECVLVPSATHGINTVLRNIDWKKGDVIVTSMAVPHVLGEVADGLL